MMNQQSQPLEKSSAGLKRALLPKTRWAPLECKDFEASCPMSSWQMQKGEREKLFLIPPHQSWSS